MNTKAEVQVKNGSRNVGKGGRDGESTCPTDAKALSLSAHDFRPAGIEIGSPEERACQKGKTPESGKWAAERRTQNLC